MAPLESNTACAPAAPNLLHGQKQQTPGPLFSQTPAKSRHSRTKGEMAQIRPHRLPERTQGPCWYGWAKGLKWRCTTNLERAFAAAIAHHTQVSPSAPRRTLPMSPIRCSVSTKRRRVQVAMTGRDDNNRSIASISTSNASNVATRSREGGRGGASAWGRPRAGFT